MEVIPRTPFRGIIEPSRYVNVFLACFFIDFWRRYGSQGAEPVVPTEAPHHGPGAATRRRGGTGGSNRGPAATTRAPPAIAQFVYRGIGDRTIFYRPASTFSFHLESIFLSPAELRKFDKGIGDRRDCQKIMLKNGRNFPSGVLVVCVMKSTHRDVRGPNKF